MEELDHSCAACALHCFPGFPTYRRSSGLLNHKTLLLNRSRLHTLSVVKLTPEFQKLVFRLLSTKMAEDLKGAYDMADRLNPAPVATGAQPATGSNPATPKPGAAQPRNGNLSITGGPGSGSNPAKRKAPSTARESVENAFASLGLNG